MRFNHRAVLLGLALGACQPAAAGKAAPAADVETIKAQALAMVVANPDCTLMEGVERPVETIDLGGGAVGVIVGCSAGMVDMWSYLYVSRDGAAPALTPLIQYDIQGDGNWRAGDTTPNLSWDAEARQFASGIAHQASGCSNGARWRWDGARIALVQQTIGDCEGVMDGGDLPEPRTIWPTTPATPEPTPTA